VRVLEELSVMSAMGAEEAERVKVGEIEWLPSHELREVFVWSKGPRREPSSLTCVHEIFEEQARRTPDAVALRAGERRLTYADLDARSNQLARYLRRLGVGAESLVGLCLSRTPELVVGLLGVLKAGGAYLPLDAAYPAERLSFMLGDAAPRVLVTQAELAGRFAEAGGAGLRVVSLDREWGSIGAESEERVEGAAGGENLAYVIYTSGSTGRPKAAMVEHHSLVNCALETARVIGLDPSQRFLLFASLSFDVSVFQIFSTLVSGASLVMHEAPAQLSNAEIWRLCEEQGITVLDLPTAFWHQWIDEMASRDEPLGGPVRVYMTGGEKVAAEKIRAWAQLVERPSRFISSYGLTETTICNTMFACASDAPGELALSTLPIGRLLANTELYVLDEHLRPVPPGVVGELYVGGVGVVRGYRNCPDLTAERFVPDPFADAPGARLYRTGDLGLRWEDGNVEVLGRVDEQVKIRGYRVELSEVEEALCEHALVQEAVVLAREDRPGDRRLVAYVVTAQAGGPTSSELRSFVRGRLPEHMVPSVYVRLDRMPLTPNSKVDRRALPAPDAARAEPEGEYVAPQTEAELLVARVWQEVLKVEGVGLHDNFFDSGGDSMLVMQVYGRLREELDREIPMIEMFRNPTVHAMAQFLRREQAQGVEVPVEEAQGRAGRQRAAINQRGRRVKERKGNS
jgi:amino acid adenylation domain-containing protein